MTGGGAIIGTTVTLDNGVTLSFTFAPVVTWTTFTVNAGTILALGANNFTFNGTTIINAGTISSGGGIFRTTVASTLDQRGTFSAPLNVVSNTLIVQDGIDVVDVHAGTITIDGGATLSILGGHTLRANGNVTVNGELDQTGAAFFVFGGATLTNNGSSILVSDTSFTAGVHTLVGSGTFGPESVITIANGVTVIVTCLLGGGHTIGRVVILAGGTFDITGCTLSIRSININPIDNGGIFTTTGSTIAYESVLGGQTASDVNIAYNNLTINNAFGVVLGGAIVVSGTVTLTNGVFATGNFLTMGNGAAISRGGGSLTGVLVLAGVMNLIYTNIVGLIAGVEMQPAINDLTIIGLGGVTIGANVTVNGTLTLNGGPITTNANILIIAAGGSVARTAGHIIGNFRKNVGVGAGVVRTFEIGTGTSYTPVTVTFGNVTGAGMLTATTVAGDHPNIATSGLIPTASVNRYWVLTNGGVIFTNYSATFQFVSADRDANTTPLEFIIAKRDAGSVLWQLADMGVRTTTSTQAVAMVGFSDFIIANISASSGGVTPVQNFGAQSTVTEGRETLFSVPSVNIEAIDRIDQQTTKVTLYIMPGTSIQMDLNPRVLVIAGTDTRNLRMHEICDVLQHKLLITNPSAISVSVMLRLDAQIFNCPYIGTNTQFRDQSIERGGKVCLVEDQTRTTERNDITIHNARTATESAGLDLRTKNQDIVGNLLPVVVRAIQAINDEHDILIRQQQLFLRIEERLPRAQLSIDRRKILADAITRALFDLGVALRNNEAEKARAVAYQSALERYRTIYIGSRNSELATILREFEERGADLGRSCESLPTLSLLSNAPLPARFEREE